MDKKLKIPSNKHFCIRLSDEEKEIFKSAAKEENKSLGTWLKELARKQIRRNQND